MRWLVRMLIFWAISLPLFYLFGLPYALKLLTEKAQSQALEQCNQQMFDKGMVGRSDSPLAAAQTDTYCHCISDHLIFTQDDLRDAIRKQPPAALSALAESRAEICNKELDQQLNGTPAPSPTPDVDADGTIHF